MFKLLFLIFIKNLLYNCIAQNINKYIAMAKTTIDMVEKEKTINESHDLINKSADPDTVEFDDIKDTNASQSNKNIKKSLKQKNKRTKKKTKEEKKD